MTLHEIYEIVGFTASIILPFFNIPLMIRIIKRRSSDDISITWAAGIFGSLLLMEPAALISPDIIFKVFATLNVIIYFGVFFLVIYFRIKNRKTRHSNLV